jgi:hypothetical protein
MAEAITIPVDPLLLQSDDDDDDEEEEKEHSFDKPAVGGRRASQQTVIQGSADLQPFADFQRQVEELNRLHVIYEETKGRLLERLTLISTRKQEIQLLGSKLAPEELEKLLKHVGLEKGGKFKGGAGDSDSSSDSESDSSEDEGEEENQPSPLNSSVNLPLSPASRDLAGEDARKKAVKIERSVRKKSSVLVGEMKAVKGGDNSSEASEKSGKNDEAKCKRKLSVAQGLSTLQVSEMEHEIANLELKLKSTGKEVIKLETRLAVLREYTESQSNSLWGQFSNWVSSPQPSPNLNARSENENSKNYEDDFAEAVEEGEMDWKSVEAEAEKQRTLNNYTELRKLGLSYKEAASRMSIVAGDDVVLPASWQWTSGVSGSSRMLDSRQSVVIVDAGRVREERMEVQEGGVLCFIFHVEGDGFDIGFALQKQVPGRQQVHSLPWHGNSRGEIPTAAMFNEEALPRYGEKRAVRGFWGPALQTCEVAFRWDNSYSILNAKAIFFAAKIFAPGDGFDVQQLAQMAQEENEEGNEEESEEEKGEGGEESEEDSPLKVSVVMRHTPKDDLEEVQESESPRRVIGEAGDSAAGGLLSHIDTDFYERAEEELEADDDEDDDGDNADGDDLLPWEALAQQQTLQLDVDSFEELFEDEGATSSNFLTGIIGQTRKYTFVMFVVLGARQWVLRKRFSQFEKLWLQLEGELGSGENAPVFPSKAHLSLGILDEEGLEQRRHELNEFMQHLVARCQGRQRRTSHARVLPRELQNKKKLSYLGRGAVWEFLEVEEQLRIEEAAEESDEASKEPPPPDTSNLSPMAQRLMEQARKRSGSTGSIGLSPMAQKLMSERAAAAASSTPGAVTA